MALVDVNQLAAALGISPQRCQQLAHLGLPRARRGRYDLGLSMSWYIRFLQRAIEARSKGKDGAESSLISERTRQARERAEAMHRENMQARTEVMLVEVLQPQLKRAHAIATQELRKIAPRSTPDPALRSAIDAEICAILHQLGQRLDAIGKPTSSGH